MNKEDKIYLLKKERLKFQTELFYFTEKKQLYESMINKMNNYDIKNSQERFLLADLQRLVCFFESKMDVIQIKLKDTEEIFD
jgi:hypothetical protein